MKNKIFLTLVLCFLAMGLYAQNAKDAYMAAQTAYEKGDYKTTIARLKETEQILGAPNVRTSYLLAMAYYKTNNYEQCVAAIDNYLAGNPKKDSAYDGIQDILNKSNTKIAEAEAERQRKLAEQEAERKRKEEAARAKAAHEKEAAERWLQIKESTDLSVLSAFLNKYGQTPSKAAAQARYNDEKAWQDAKKINDVSSYETYLTEKTEQRYRQQARSLLEEAYPRFCKEYAAEGKIDRMEDLYNRYVTMFPNGSKKSELHDAMCKVYYNQGVSHSKIKTVSSLSKSTGYLEKAQNLCPGRYKVSSIINKNERKSTKLLRDDFGIIGYAGDNQSPIGFTIGKLNQRKLGWYLTTRVSAKFVSQYVFKGMDAEIDENGEIKGIGTSAGGQITLDGKKHDANVNFVFGLTKKIIQPIWLYAGGGASYNNVIEQYTFSKEGRTEKYWAKYTEEAKWKPVIDAGVFVKLGGFVLNGGARTTLKNHYVTFGLQFKI